MISVPVVSMPIFQAKLPAWAQPSCDNRRAYSALFGGVSAVTGLDQMFHPMVPPTVHWAIAGGLADASCSGFKMPEIDEKLFECSIFGMLGGIGARLLLR